MRGVLALAVGVVLARATLADAARPVLAGEATFGQPGGAVLVHYTRSGADAVPLDDADDDGVPDFVEEVAHEAETALAHFETLGFRRPIGDGTLGGDARIDIYLRDLSAADGNAIADFCDETGCAGHAIAENDYAGYSYPSRTEAIRSVVPHELFHIVQFAYSLEQPSTWTEGSAVWAVEHLYGAGNSDFERFLPSFLGRTYRPFERPSGGFGDAYPYGAALWPYFLADRFGVDAVVAAWEGCETAPFLDAIDEALAIYDASLETAWIEFTRKNAFTGEYAIASSYPDAAQWSTAPREPVLDSASTVYVEGLSARYVPVTVGAPMRITASPGRGISIAAWVADASGNGVELVPHGDVLAAPLDPGTYTLVLTGLSSGTLTTPVELTLEPRQDPPADDDDSSGCSTSSTSRTSTGLVAPLALALGALLRYAARTSSSRLLRNRCERCSPAPRSRTIPSAGARGHPPPHPFHAGLASKRQTRSRL
jgi:hypothetical protein